MNDEEKIHTLVQELLFMEKEVDETVKGIIHDHVNTCEECHHLRADIKKTEIPTIDNSSSKAHITPLKSLRKLNIGVLVFTILVRIGVLLYIVYGNSFETYPYLFEDVLQASITIFYLPSAIFLLLLTFIFLKPKIFVGFLVFDVGVLLFGSHFISYFI
ncbi:hypothetical protein [Paraliobacillus ryukyuensis]|uniref:hypothetical protein n=1 Tax=Paraliobacillus ryukyuensis TaxID=200904 RepID=UPI0009A752E2|nr:hypothetical protein [Paraliobacillus ryukyuensis]